MPTKLRRATVIAILMGTFLVPFLAEAKTPARSRGTASRFSLETGVFALVWDLLGSLRDQGASAATYPAKNGGQMDPSGMPGPTPPSGNSLTGPGGDNGGQMDPSGVV